MKRLLLALAGILSLSPNLLAAEGPAPSGLMLDLHAMPERVAITNRTPRLSWIVNSTAVDDLQTAYQIRLFPSQEVVDIPEKAQWDSGKVESNQSVAVKYTGAPLEPNRVYAWRVKTWTMAGVESGWSMPQSFKTGEFRTATSGAGGADRITVDRYPIVQTAVAPVEIHPMADGRQFVDFGRDAYAGLVLKLGSASGGEKVVVRLGEALTAPGQINRKPGGSIRYLQSEITLQKGLHAYPVLLGPKDGRNMPEYVGAVMPFRYVEVENCPGLLTKQEITQFATHYPFDESAAKFNSSDKALNDVWELCRYSMKATSFCGLYVDGDRERLPYEADAYINQLGHYAADREFTLARYSHEHLMLHPTWPTEWIMHSVLIAWADYLYTGNEASLTEFYDDVKAKTLYQIERPDGLISITPKSAPPKEVLAAIHRDKAKDKLKDIVDWPVAERDGYEMKEVNTVVNAFHCRSLVLMAKMAAALNNTKDAELFRSLAEKAIHSFNERFLSQETGLYIDGSGSQHSSLHANMFALAFELVPAERMAPVAAFVKSRGMATSVYGAQYLMEALYATGQGEYARGLVTAKTDRSWAHMAYDTGTTITLEAWDNKYKPNQDWNHAWGAAPANTIPRLLMGIEPIEPGFAKARIKPQLGGLEKASMDLPTIRGTIHLACESSPTRFIENLNLPANMTAVVYVPGLNDEGTTVLIDGAPRQGKREGDWVLVDGVGSGPHKIERVGKP